MKIAVNTQQDVCGVFTQLCTSGQCMFLSRMENGDVHRVRQGKATLCSVFWGCFSTSLHQDLPLAAVQGKGGTAEQYLDRSTGNHKLNTAVTSDWVLQMSWFV